jgi:hypothetical protein
MSGGALVASHHLITSTKQINPKVLKKLIGKTDMTGLTGAQGKAGSPGAQDSKEPRELKEPKGPQDYRRCPRCIWTDRERRPWRRTGQHRCR